MEFDDLSHRVIGCAIEVYRALGPGLLESAYEQCHAHELRRNNLSFILQHTQPVEYKGIQLGLGDRSHDELKRLLHRIVSMLTHLIARSDAVAESAAEYNAEVEYEYRGVLATEPHFALPKSAQYEARLTDRSGSRPFVGHRWQRWLGES